jgi:hypothetical protein
VWNPPREGPLEVEEERGREGPEAAVEVAGSCPVDRTWCERLWSRYPRPVTLSRSRWSRLNAQRSVAAGRERGSNVEGQFSRSPRQRGTSPGPGACDGASSFLSSACLARTGTTAGRHSSPVWGYEADPQWNSLLVSRQSRRFPLYRPVSRCSGCVRPIRMSSNVKGIIVATHSRCRRSSVESIKFEQIHLRCTFDDRHLPQSSPDSGTTAGWDIQRYIERIIDPFARTASQAGSSSSVHVRSSRFLVGQAANGLLRV